MYHAQPRHCLQRISCPDHGQLRAPVLEPAGCCVRLNKPPPWWRQRRRDDAIPARTGIRPRTAGERVAVDAATKLPGACEVLRTRTHVSHVISPCDGQQHKEAFDESVGSVVVSALAVAGFLSKWRIGATSALRSSQPYAKRLKFLSWKGGRVV